MPPASRFLVRAALIHLLLGSAVGALLLAAKGAPRLTLLGWTWRGAHVELLAVGFTVQLALGVAHWILPRDADRPPAAAPAWIAAGLLNAGVLLGVAGAAAGNAEASLAGRALQACAVAVFAAHAWPRVRAARELSLPAGSRGRSR